MCVSFKARIEMLYAFMSATAARPLFRQPPVPRFWTPTLKHNGGTSAGAEGVTGEVVDKVESSSSSLSVSLLVSVSCSNVSSDCCEGESMSSSLLPSSLL
jgi:hypothetical protein